MDECLRVRECESGTMLNESEGKNFSSYMSWFTAVVCMCESVLGHEHVLINSVIIDKSFVLTQISQCVVNAVLLESFFFFSV